MVFIFGIQFNQQYLNNKHKIEDPNRVLAFWLMKNLSPKDNVFEIGEFETHYLAYKDFLIYFKPELKIERLDNLITDSCTFSQNISGIIMIRESSFCFQKIKKSSQEYLGKIYNLSVFRF